MRIVTEVKKTKLFKFSELSKSAQSNAISNWRSKNPTDDWFHELRNQFVKVLEAIGFSQVEMIHSGFCCQGDGASFSAEYKHKPESRKAVYTLLTAMGKPKTLDMVLLHLDDILAVQKRHAYKVIASVRNASQYSHSGVMRIETEKTVVNGDREIGYKDERILVEAFRGLADAYYDLLYTTYYDSTSDERAQAYLESHNDYEYLENGKRYC